MLLNLKSTGLKIVFYGFYCAIDPDSSSVDHQIIIIRGFPFFSSIVAEIIPSFSVDPLDIFFSIFCSIIFFFNGTFLPEIHVCIDKYAHQAFQAFQNIISAAAHDNAVFFSG